MPSPKPTSNQDPSYLPALSWPGVMIITALLFVAVRTWIGQPFHIPSSSMVPTLRGSHVTAQCPHCKHTQSAEANSPSGQLTKRMVLCCPKCGYLHDIPAGTPTKSGDLIWVSHLPSNYARFDPVVFQSPLERDSQSGSPGPRTTLVKRIVALPGEEVYLLDGNILTRSDPQADFQIARKCTDLSPQTLARQQRLWHPIFNLRERVDQPTWQTTQGTATALNAPEKDLLKLSSKCILEILLDGHNSKSTAPLNPLIIHPWNQPRIGAMSPQRDNPEELSLSCNIICDPTQANPHVEFCLPDARPAPVRVCWSTKSIDLHIGTQHKQIQIDALRPGSQHQLTLWWVDRTLIAWFDNQAIAMLEAPGDEQTLFNEPPPTTTPRILLKTQETTLLRDLQVSIDHNWQANSGLGVVHGGLTRNQHNQIIRIPPLTLPTKNAHNDDGYLCLGDNSPYSLDGRFWRITHPDVRDLLLPHAATDGVVPRTLIIGHPTRILKTSDKSQLFLRIR